jgi:hypothetical protein
LAIAGLSLDARSSGLTFVTLVSGLAALFVLATVLVLARPGWIGAALGLLALLYCGHLLVADGSNIGELGLVSVGLLLVGELSQWSIDGRLAGRHERGLQVSRAAGICGLAVLGVGTVVLTMLAAGLPLSGSLLTAATATVASVALLGLISFVALQRVNAPNVPLPEDH